MKAAAAVLLLALAAPAAAGSAEEFASAMAGADRSAARLEQELSELAAPRLAGRYKDEADCLARLSVDELLRDATGSAMVQDMGGRILDGFVQMSFRYYTCVAAARGGPGACAGLGRFDDYAAPHPRLECERYSKELRFVRALMTGSPDAPALCRADLTHPEDNEFYARDIDTVCGIVLAGYKDPKTACAKLSAYFMKPSQLKKCRAWLGSFSGGTEACRHLKDDDVKERCFAYSYFSKARETKDPADCRDSPICRFFLSGDEADCGAIAGRIAKRLCREQPRLNAELRAKAASVRAELEAAEAPLKALPESLAASARLRRLELVRARLDALP